VSGIYILNGWRRICSLMRADFAPYLQHILPGVFQLAAMKPTLAVQGEDNNIEEVLQDETSGGKKKDDV
jgi:hypothetical protein